EIACFREQAKEIDIVITTALIPGRPAPELWMEDMVKSMQEGSVIVDLAAENGGNCKLTKADKVIQKHGVTIIGYTDMPSRLPTQSSQLYATNLRHLLTDLCPEKDGNIFVNMEDEVIRGTTVINSGEITWPPPPPKVSAAPAKPAPEPASVVEAVVEEKPQNVLISWLPAAIGVLAMLGLGSVAPASFMSHFTVFVLACFIGYMVIWNVKPALHTPLMSVTNAISSIIVIGALLQISSDSGWIVFLSALAVLITSINIFGGFAVTQRMLAMFRR
ncbi:MAG TPA: Re/Si-specific NAD(P)(+) transhydrogenase subunit alpha, partial [Gammaproteobacteria bacterium]|nr:Re/Si-specific NAD(P)(+) transhydrogenase subunit alpha [Gammaproteobacteria bacterium]